MRVLGSVLCEVSNLCSVFLGGLAVCDGGRTLLMVDGGVRWLPLKGAPLFRSPQVHDKIKTVLL